VNAVKTIRIVVGRITQAVGVIAALFGLLCLLFACSPANTGDAPFLLEAAKLFGASGVGVFVVGTLVVGRTRKRPG